MDPRLLDPDALKLAQPDTSIPVAPQSPASALDPRIVEAYAKALQLPAGLDPEGLKAAQAADIQRENDFRLAQAGERATAMMQRRPADFTGLTNDQLNVRNWVQQRQMADQDRERQMQLATLPIKAREWAAEIRNKEAEGPLKEAQAAGALADVPAKQAHAQMEKAQAHGAELENGPPPPAMVAIARQFGVTPGPQDTTKSLRETTDAAAKAKGIQLDWAKVGLEGERVGLERTKQQIELETLRSNHPMEPVPGFRFTGVGMPLDRNSQPVQELATKQATTSQLINHLDEMEKIYSRADAAGHVVGADAQRLATLKTQLSGMIGRNASGGRLAEYDVVLGNNQLPDPTSANPFTGGAFRPEKMKAAIGTIRKMARDDLSDLGRAHHMLPTAEAAKAAANRLRAAGISDPAAIKAALREAGY